MALIDDLIRHWSRRQLGLVLAEQLRDGGASRSAIRHQVDQGELVKLSCRLLRCSTVAVSDKQRALAGVLDSGRGTALSRDSAVALWGVPGFFLLPADVAHRRGTAPAATRLARVHEMTRLPEDMITELDSIPVVSVSLALFQLTALHHPLRVARAIDSALSIGICSSRSLHHVLDVMARSGRDGVAEFRRLIAERDEHYKPPESGKESRLQWILDRAGERRLRRQVDVGSEEEWLGRMDFIDEIDPFVLQVDSERYHGALIDTRRDERQTADLEAAGFVVRRVWDTDLWHRPDLVVKRVREGRRLARTRRLGRTEDP